MKSPHRKLSRRNFLLAIGAGGAAATAALVTQEGDKTPGNAGAASASGGYRLTEHIQKYYRTTKV